MKNNINVKKQNAQLLTNTIIAYFAIPGALLLFAGLMMLIFPLRETPLNPEEIQALIAPQIIFLTKYKLHISLFIPTLLATLWCFLPGEKHINIIRACGIFAIMYIAIPLVINALVLGAEDKPAEKIYNTRNAKIDRTQAGLK